MQHKLDILITATAKGLQEVTRKTATDLQTGFKKGQIAVKAFNEAAGNGRKTVSALSGTIKGLLAGFVGFQALRSATTIMRDADTAAFSMQTSVAAANREFENVGAVSDWEQTVRRLSDELRIYSDTALKNAVSRTVDMTKRLGLSKEQMEEVIKRSADLGAGKVELEGAIERVTAALRGEAESAEYLGLTLNENYIKAWYEANTVTEKAWKDLTDLEKAQVRYQVMLEQSNELQGRAAKSADTFGGSLREINKEITNAITNNRDVNAAMREVAKVLKENAGAIGNLVSIIVTAAARVVEFTVKYKNLLLVLAGTGAAVAVVSRLVATIKGLNAASSVFTGMGIIPWLGNLRTALTAAAAETTALTGALGKAGLAGAAALGAFQIGELIKVIYEWRKVANENKRMAEQERANAEQYAHAKDIEIQSAEAFTRMTEKEKEAYRENLKAAVRYWGGLAAAATRAGKDASEYEQQFNRIFQAIKKLKAPEDIQPAIKVNTTELSEEEKKKIAHDRRKLEEQLAKELSEISGGKWAALLFQAKKHYEAEVALAHGRADLLADAERVYSDRVRQIEAERGKERSERAKREAASLSQSQVARLKGLAETSLLELDALYGKGQVSIRAYFDQRRKLIEEQYQAEIAAKKKVLALETDPAERRTIEDDLFLLEQAHKRELIALAREQAGAEEAVLDKKKQAEELIANARERTRRLGAVSLKEQFAVEMDDLTTRQEAEMGLLRERLQGYENFAEKKRLIDELAAQHDAERRNLALSHERDFQEARLQMASDIAGGMADIFDNLYELTGKKQKEFFYLSKGAALLQAIINTAQAVTKALAQGGFLGIAQAAAVSAMGAVQIAKIGAQKLAGGGAILGRSPHSKADNIPVMATAGEWMHPVDTVRYYGSQVMEAMRQRLIPRELFAGLRLPSFSVPRPAWALAAGGPVPANASGSGQGQEGGGIHIVNVIDPNLLDRYMASNAGQKTVLNVLSQNSFMVKQILSEA